MPKTTKVKVDPKQAVDAAKVAKEKLQNNAVTKKAGEIFKKIQEKTGVDNKKIDKWQNAWLEMPETRKKYEHLKDAPQMVLEEALGMTNDIIDFVQGEEVGESHVFASIKSELSEAWHNPMDYFQKKIQEGKDAAMKAKKIAEEKALQAKGMAEKAQKGGLMASATGLAGGLMAKAKEQTSKATDMAKDVKKTAEKKTKAVKETAKKTTKKAKKK